MKKKFTDKQSFSIQQSKPDTIQRCSECQNLRRAKKGCQECKRVPVVYRQIRIEDLGDGTAWLTVPKFGKVLIAYQRAVIGSIGTLTISTDAAGRDWASFTSDDGCDSPEKPAIVPQSTRGFDAGLKTLLVDNTGHTIESKKHLKPALEKIKYWNRRLALKRRRLFANCPCGYVHPSLSGQATHWTCPKCGKERTLRDIHQSKRYTHEKLRLAKVHATVADQRADHLHKASHSVTTSADYDTIAIQSTNIKGMMKNHKLARSLSDMGWGELERQIEYKADREGKNVIRCGYFEATSKTCWHQLPDGNICGHVNHDLSLEDREWTCPKCNTHHDRDINGAQGAKVCSLKEVGFEAT